MERTFIRSILLLFICLNMTLGTTSIFAQSKEAAYHFKINLNEVENDRLYVELEFPEFFDEEDLKKEHPESLSLPDMLALVNEKTATYHLPKVIPGTYSVKNYGSFVSDFKASDAKGKSLKVKRKDKNTWEISKPKKLAKISYWVDDTWDTPEAGEDIFEPGGTGFNADSCFVINPFGVFGYFKGMEKYKGFKLEVTKPESFYGATALKDADPDNKKDVFYTEDYHRLADSPIMYSKPDTAWLKAGNTDVLVALYSPNKVVTAKEIAKSIAPILKAQEAYLGGKLPVDKYAYIIRLATEHEVTEVENKGVRMGALEHSYSSFYFLLEPMPKDRLMEMMEHAAAHEFFHIVTPLSIHSEEIENFDFNNPKMSKHLWLYEGMTEYSSHHAMLKGGITTLKEFIPAMGRKIENMRDEFDDNIPFTELSEQILKHQDQFRNVYEKGAIIAMCLDIKLLELSGGKYGTQDLMLELSTKYGKHKAFKDDELFDVITEMTYPEIRTFFKKHVEGNEPLPIDEILDKVGLKFGDKVTQELMLYKSLGYNEESGNFEFKGYGGRALELSKLGEALGFLPDDQLISASGIAFTMENISQATKELREKVKAGDELNVVVRRKQTDGSFKEITLTTTAFEEERTLKRQWDVYHYDPKKEITGDNKVLKEKVDLRNTWLGMGKENP